MIKLNNKTGKVILALVFATIVCVLLASCAKTSKEASIVGKWIDTEYETDIMEFTEDGKCIYSNSGGSMTLDYVIEGDKLILSAKNVETVIETTFEIKNDELILMHTDDSKQVLVREK